MVMVNKRKETCHDQFKNAQIAAQRMKLIAPLLSPGLDKATYQRLKEQISQESGLSERTLRRYLALYQEKGYAGLLPAKKQYPHQRCRTGRDPSGSHSS
jgi:hypothetical protein